MAFPILGALGKSIVSGLGSSLVSGVLDLFGSNKQEKFNSAEAQKQRDWQTDMSNTAYQRAAADLQAAGLNRVLAFGNPATTPSGATASIEAPKLGNSVQTGINAASAIQSIAQSRATEQLQKEQTNTERMQQHLIKEQANQSSTQSLLNVASARHQNATATKNELFNPIQKLGNDLLEKMTNFGRSAAKEYTDAAEKKTAEKEFNHTKYRPINRDSLNPEARHD